MGPCVYECNKAPCMSAPADRFCQPDGNWAGVHVVRSRRQACMLPQSCQGGAQLACADCGIVWTDRAALELECDDTEGPATSWCCGMPRRRRLGPPAWYQVSHVGTAMACCALAASVSNQIMCLCTAPKRCALRGVSGISAHAVLGLKAAGGGPGARAGGAHGALLRAQPGAGTGQAVHVHLHGLLHGCARRLLLWPPFLSL